MDSKTTQRLNDILDRYDDKEKQKVETERRSKTERDEFLEKYEAHLISTVRPALEELAVQLRARGHGIEVVDRAPVRAHAGDAPALTISLHPGGDRPSSIRFEDSAYVSFTAAPAAKGIAVHESTMAGGSGSAGPRGEYPLSQVDAALIAKSVLDVVEKAFVRGGF